MQYSNQYTTYYTVTIDNNGNIMGTRYEESRTSQAYKIGVTTAVLESAQAKIKDLQETVDLYYDKLVELGALTRPKTQEEINKEQADLINKQAAAMDEMLSIIKDLKEATKTTKSTPTAPIQATPVSIETPLPVVVVEDKPVTKTKGASKKNV